MLNMLNNLLLDTYPDWIANSFPIIRIVMMVLIALCAIAIVIVVMMSESNPEGGTNVISGTTDSFYSKNKSSTKEGRLKKIIIICGIAIAVLAILFFVSLKIYPANI